MNSKKVVTMVFAVDSDTDAERLIETINEGTQHAMCIHVDVTDPTSEQEHTIREIVLDREAAGW